MHARVVTHTGAFSCGGTEHSFTRWESQDGTLNWDFEAKTPFVLLHGFAQSAHTWAKLAPALAAVEGVGAVYALEFAGHGESERPVDARPYSMEAACECVRGFCAWVARREGALPVLAGYSMGGRIALEAFARAQAGEGPLDVRALVLESAGLGPVDEAARKALRERNEGWAGRVREEGVAAFMGYWESLPLFETQRALPPELRAKLREARERNDAEALARTFEGTGQHCQSLQGQALSALAASAVPVLYLFGELDAKYAAVAQLLGQACPNVAVCGVSQAGHNIHLEQPDAFVRALTGLL